MSIMQWQENLSVGVNEIDNQHKALINIINRIDDCIDSPSERQQLEKLLPELHWYASEHFKHEELFMFETSYPQREEHREIHHEMLSEVQNLIDNLSKEITETQHIADFFKKWLLKHITVEDQDYAKHAEVLPQAR